MTGGKPNCDFCNESNTKTIKCEANGEPPQCKRSICFTCSKFQEIYFLTYLYTRAKFRCPDCAGKHLETVKKINLSIEIAGLKSKNPPTSIPPPPPIPMATIIAETWTNTTKAKSAEVPPVVGNKNYPVRTVNKRNPTNENDQMLAGNESNPANENDSTLTVEKSNLAKETDPMLAKNESNELNPADKNDPMLTENPSNPANENGPMFTKNEKNPTTITKNGPTSIENEDDPDVEKKDDSIPTENHGDQAMVNENSPIPTEIVENTTMENENEGDQAVESEKGPTSNEYVDNQTVENRNGHTPISNKGEQVRTRIEAKYPNSPSNTSNNPLLVVQNDTPEYEEGGHDKSNINVDTKSSEAADSTQGEEEIFHDSLDYETPRLEQVETPSTSLRPRDGVTIESKLPMRTSQAGETMNTNNLQESPPNVEPPSTMPDTSNTSPSPTHEPHTMDTSSGFASKLPPGDTRKKLSAKSVLTPQTQRVHVPTTSASTQGTLNVNQSPRSETPASTSHRTQNYKDGETKPQEGQKCLICKRYEPEERYLSCGERECNNTTHWRCSLKNAVDIARFTYTGAKYKCRDCSIAHVRNINKFTETECDEKIKEILQYLYPNMPKAHNPRPIPIRTYTECPDLSLSDSSSEESGDETVSTINDTDKVMQTTSINAEEITPRSSEDTGLHQEVTPGNGTPKPLPHDLRREGVGEEMQHQQEEEQETLEEDERKRYSQIDCKFFLAGNCKFKQECRYKHPKICRNFIRDPYKTKGYGCRFNEECIFRHPNLCTSWEYQRECSHRNRGKFCIYFHRENHWMPPRPSKPPVSTDDDCNPKFESGHPRPDHRSQLNIQLKDSLYPGRNTSHAPYQEQRCQKDQNTSQTNNPPLSSFLQPPQYPPTTSNDDGEGTQAENPQPLHAHSPPHIPSHLTELHPTARYIQNDRTQIEHHNLRPTQPPPLYLHTAPNPLTLPEWPYMMQPKLKTTSYTTPTLLPNYSNTYPPK